MSQFFSLHPVNPQPRLIRETVKILRGGAFKPRSSPYSFQGLGEEGLRLMRRAADRHGLLVVSEVMPEIPALAAASEG